MRTLFILLLSLALMASGGAAASSAFEYDWRAGRGASLAASTWPSDHGDVSRAKYSIGAGLPKNFNPADLKVTANHDLECAQWLYTGGENSEFVYVLGGARTKFVAKVDAVTLKTLGKYYLEDSLYLGGLLVHANGNVYAVQGNRLYVFWGGNMHTNVTRMWIPTNLNHHLTETNGMLVTQDGLLVVKQWNLIPDDLGLMASANNYVYSISTAVIVICITASVSFGVDRKRMAKQSALTSAIALLVRAVTGALVGVFLCILIITAVLQKMTGDFNPMRMWTSNTIHMNGGGTGELKFIDPLTLRVVAETVLPDRCSIARMTMVAVPEDEGENDHHRRVFVHGDAGGGSGDRRVKEELLVLLSDEFAYQYRFNPKTRKIRNVPAWTQRYRHRGSGNYPATGATIINNTAYFTDNTFPVWLRGRSYTMFRMPLFIDETTIPAPIDESRKGYYLRPFLEGVADPAVDRTPVPDRPIHAIHLTNETQNPGFMFWSVVGSPAEGDMITWDTANKVVQARRLETLDLKWQLSAFNADCLTVAADRGHVYLSDYSRAPDHSSKWLAAVGNWHPFGSTSKFFIVADTATGAVLANVTVAVDEGIKLSMIIPGARNDVFIGTPKGLRRVYV